MTDLSIDQLDPKYKAVVQHYADQGASMLAGDAAVAADYLAKAEKVLEDAAAGGVTGAGIGAAIPILGELGITEVIGGYAGTYIAGVIGAFDQFGGDITRILHNVLNPEDFTPGDYDRERLRCISSGGVPNPGFPPDNECGCIYPSGGTSGGEWPRDPGPGKAVRGDNPYSRPMGPGECPDANGDPCPCQKIAAPPKPALSATYAITSANQAAAAKATATAQILANLKSIKSLPKMVAPPKLQVMTPAAQHIVVTALANATSAAHAVVTAAKSGDQGAIDAINGVAAQANAGDPSAIHTMAILTVADAEQWVNQMIDRFVFGKAS